MRTTEGTALCTNYTNSSPQLNFLDLVQCSCNRLSTRVSPTPSEDMSQTTVALLLTNGGLSIFLLGFTPLLQTDSPLEGIGINMPKRKAFIAPYEWSNNCLHTCTVTQINIFWVQVNACIQYLLAADTLAVSITQHRVNLWVVTTCARNSSNRQNHPSRWFTATTSYLICLLLVARNIILFLLLCGLLAL